MDVIFARRQSRTATDRGPLSRARHGIRARRCNRIALSVAAVSLLPKFLNDRLVLGGPRLRIGQHWRRRDSLIRADMHVGSPEPLLHAPSFRGLDVSVLVLAHQVDRRLAAWFLD